MYRAPMVVGYKGEIGRFILSGLLEHLPKANDIHCTDVSNSDEDVIERLDKAHFVFLCVPIQETAAWLRRFGPHLQGKTVVEQCSVKGFLYEDSAFDDLNLLSMHLLFRPSGTPVAERKGLVFSMRHSAEEIEKFRAEIQETLQTPISLLTPTDEPAYVVHDRIMARQQALIHRVLLVLSESLGDESMRTFVGSRVCELADRVRAGDPSLYRIIQQSRYLPDEIAEFESRLRAFTVDA